MRRYSEFGPSFTPSSLEAETKSNLITQLHDLYITSIQSAMYRPTPPWGPFMTRKDAQDEIIRQLFNIEEHVSEEGDFLTGSEVSLADASLFPSMIFLTHMLPKYGYSLDTIIPPKLMKWYTNLPELKPQSFGRVFTEVSNALKGWDDSGRFDGILGTTNNKD